MKSDQSSLKDAPAIKGVAPKPKVAPKTPASSPALKPRLLQHSAVTKIIAEGRKADKEAKTDGRGK